MNSNGIDRLIARYLDGMMSAAEQGEFMARLERDPELLRQTRLEQAIRSTMVQERERIPANHAATRAQTMSLLSKVPAAGSGAAAIGAAASGAGGGILAGGALKIVLIALATLGAVVAAWIIIPRLNTGTSFAPQQGEVAPVRPLSPQDTAQPEAPLMQTGSSTVPASPAAPEISAPRQNSDVRKETSAPKRRGEETTKNSLIPENSRASEPASPSEPAMERQEQPRVFREDSLRTKVKIE